VRGKKRPEATTRTGETTRKKKQETIRAGAGSKKNAPLAHGAAGAGFCTRSVHAMQKILRGSSEKKKGFS